MMQKKSYLILVSVCSAVILAAAVFSLIYLNRSDSVLNVCGESLIALNVESRGAHVKNPAKHPYLYYKFTDNQEASLKAMADSDHGACVKVSFDFGVRPAEGSAFVGFLYREDFSGKKRLTKSISKRPLCMAEFDGKDYLDCKDSLDVSFAVDKDHVPLGFFVYCSVPCVISKVEYIHAQVGWKKSVDGSTPLFAFGPEGGKCDFTYQKVDFSDCGKLFSDHNDEDNIMPYIEFGMESCQDYGNWLNQKRVDFSAGGEELSIRRNSVTDDVVIQTSGLKNPFGVLEVESNLQMVDSVIMAANDKSLIHERNKKGNVLLPLKTDLGLIVEWPQDNWRCKDYELYQWEEMPGVLFFDFADYNIQNKFLTRLAYFVEKTGYRGTFISDEMIDTVHGYNAHDYKSDDLARFFTEAVKQNVRLNSYELLLQDILVANRIIIEDGKGGFSAGNGAVISISRESQMYLRYTLMAHESWHGIYFTDEDFRNTVAACFYMFDETSLDFIETFWETQSSLNYDRSDEYLMKNEFMAYLMQQSLSRTKEYFLQIAGRGSVNRFEPELALYVRDTGAQAFEDAAGVLNDYAFTRWGLAAGRVNLVTRK